MPIGLPSHDKSDGTRGALRLAAGVAAVAFFIDQATKTWALALLENPMHALGRLGFFLERNDAFAFSTHSGAVEPAVVIAVRLVTLAAILVVCQHLKGLWTRRNVCGVALIISGGLGNTADLIFRDGAVVDFIGVTLIGMPGATGAPQPNLVFNVADVFILLGTGLAVPVLHEVSRITHERVAAAWQGARAYLTAAGGMDSGGTHPG